MDRIRFHPQVARVLEAIALWIVAHAGSQAADRNLAEVEQTNTGPARMPHNGIVHDDMASSLRGIPAGRRAVIVFTVDDTTEEVLIRAVTDIGGDWTGRSRARTL